MRRNQSKRDKSVPWVVGRLNRWVCLSGLQLNTLNHLVLKQTIIVINGAMPTLKKGLLGVRTIPCLGSIMVEREQDVS